MNKKMVGRLAVLMVLVVGMASMGAALVEMDDFEDNDIQGWTGDTGALSTTTDSNYETYSGILEASGFNSVRYQHSTTDDYRFSVRVPTSSDDSGTYHGIVYMEDSAAALFCNIRFYTNGDIDVCDGGSNPVISSFSKGDTLDFVFKPDYGTDSYTLEIDGTSYGSYDFGQSGSNLEYIKPAVTSSTSGTHKFVVDNVIPNTAPEFNSSSVSPDPPLIGENVKYDAEVYDSDGTIQNTTLDVSGLITYNEDRTGTTPTWDNLPDPSSEGWLNATYTTYDDAGATTTQEINRYLSNEAPTVSLNNPANQTYYKYDVPVDFSVSDSDSNPQEDYNCDINKDGALYEEVYLKEGTNSTYTGTVRSDLGSHNVEVSCNDPAGNTGTAIEDYTVEVFELNSVSGNNQVFETTEQQYTTDMTTGNMVNKVTTTLNYDSQNVDSTTNNPAGVSTFSLTNSKTVGLVQTNQTAKNWYTETTYNYTKINGNYATQSVTSTTQTQDILHSYYLESSSTDPSDGDYIEKQELKHDVKVHTETKKADLSGLTTYKRDSTTDEMSLINNQTNSETFRGVIDTGLADSFNKSTFQTESTITVQFNNDSRTFSTGNDPVNVYKIKVTDGSTNLNTAKALEFDIDYEENDYDAAAQFTMDLSVFQKGEEVVRRYQFTEDAAKTHSYYIYPSWASYKIQTKPYPDQRKFDLIQYYNDNNDYVRRSYFFPTAQTISDTVTTVPLKTINKTEASKIDFEVTNSEGDPAQNTYCRVDRKFGGGNFETVFMIKTGGEGKSQSFAEVNEIYYGFTCYKNGQIADRFSAQIMQDPMRLNLGGSNVETNLDYYKKFDGDCTKNTTSVSCDYQSQTEDLKQAKLQVYRQEVMQDQLVCEQTSPTATGKLTCNGLNSTANYYQYELNGEYTNQITVPGTTGYLGEQPKAFPGAVGLIMVAILFMLVMAATAFNVIIGIGAGTLVLLTTSMLNWIILTPSQQATLIAVAVIAGVAASR